MEASPATQPPGRERGDLLRMAAILAVLLAVTGLTLLLTQGGGDAGPARGAVEGRLVVVNEEQLVLQPADGSEPMRFRLKPVTARQLDLFHLQDHMAQGLATIVTYEREGDTLYALSADDA
jgi:hypothetical protein